MEKNDTDIAKDVSFEEIMFTIISATQDVFREYMNIQLLAGQVERKVKAVNMDLVSIVGIGGHRVGYIMIGAGKRSARIITQKMLMDDEIDEPCVRDTFGELANNIGGAFKTKYYKQYGMVAMGLPLVASGRIQPIGAPSASKSSKKATLKVQQQGAVIPFQSADGTIKLIVMFYM